MTVLPFPPKASNEESIKALRARMAEIQRDLGGATGPTLERLLEEKLRIRRALAALGAF